MISLPSSQEKVLDSSGIGLSLLCLVHCVGTPIFLALGLPGAHFFGDESTFHSVFAVLICVVTYLAMAAGWRRHGRRRPSVVAAFGVFFLLLALYFPGVTHHPAVHLAGEAHQHVEMPLDIFSRQSLLTIAGGTLLLLAHLLNIRGCRCSCCSHAENAE